MQEFYNFLNSLIKIKVENNKYFFVGFEIEILENEILLYKNNKCYSCLKDKNALAGMLLLNTDYFM